MNVEERKSYGSVRLLDIECTTPYDWQENDFTHMRVCLPATLENMLIMREKGFHFADRVLDVSINLIRSKLDFVSLIRTPPILATGRRDEVRRIASDSFPFDRRFHLGLEYDKSLSDTVISAWVDELKEYYISENKGNVIGFLALRKSEDRAFVHLAAVLEKYRASGAALSLYATAAKDCKEQGFRALDGRISTQNTAVMNLYSFLGASFSNPIDVYLKEV